MRAWLPDHYLLFEEERTRPCRELAAHLRVDRPRTVIDLGCGPGNSTAVLAERWPDAKITGLDSSAEMLERARQKHPRHEWVQGGIHEWALSDGEAYDVVFSNAALHWLADHAGLYARLFARVAAGGVLATQVPANIHDVAHRMMRDVASSAKWRDRFPAGGVREWFVHEAAFYYDALATAAGRVDIWETTYQHVMPNVESIGEWYKTTGLRPFLAALPNQEDRDEFVRDYTEAARAEFKPRPDGCVLFPFKRLFVVAAK
jgi:trans-aconitate 2-methyltransferase